jgi:hypothetical protein
MWLLCLIFRRLSPAVDCRRDLRRVRGSPDTQKAAIGLVEK